MKNSNEWNRQSNVDQAADAHKLKHKCEIIEVTPYRLAKEMGWNCNGSLCQKVYDWQGRRLAESKVLSTEVPPNVDAQFRALVLSQVDEQCKQFTSSVGQWAADNERHALLRIAEEKCLRVNAEVAKDTVIKVCLEAEERLESALALIASLQEELADSHRKQEYWRGRCDQREASVTQSNRGAGVTQERKTESVDRMLDEFDLSELTTDPDTRDPASDKPDKQQDSMF